MDVSVGVLQKMILIDGCTVFKGHGGFVVGSEMSGGVQNISVANCQFLWHRCGTTV